jgi:2-C-methyl-D-erythritol 4-phosphate cytidylyltransferase
MSVAADAIIVAGGSGERFGSVTGKQLLTVAGMPVLSWSILGVAAAPEVAAVVVVCHPERVEEYLRVAVEPLGLEVSVTVVPGGATRQASVQAGLDSITDPSPIVVVHDGARPLVDPHAVSDAVAVIARGEADGVVVGHPSVDTLKVVDEGVVVDTPDRSRYWEVQTPQAFSSLVLRDAYRRAAVEGFLGTDDASLVERTGATVRVLEGSRENLKVTRPEDLALIEVLLERRRRERL